MEVHFHPGDIVFLNKSLEDEKAPDNRKHIMLSRDHQLRFQYQH